MTKVSKRVSSRAANDLTQLLRLVNRELVPLVAELRERLNEAPFAHAVKYDVEFSASASETIEHGLGVAFKGAIIGACSPLPTVHIHAYHPDDQLADLSVDPATYVVVKASANHTGTVSVWVW